MEQSFKHQREAVELLGANEFLALLMEQGTGKSRPIIEDWLNRIDAGRNDDLIVLGPKGAYMNWIGTPDEPGEIMKWVPPERLAGIHYAPWISNARVADRKALENLLYAKGPRFLCMNIESLNTKGAAREYLLQFASQRRTICAIDESTMMAHESAQRTTFLLDNSKLFATRRILSGLVAPESPLDLYSQYLFLDWRIVGQRSFFGFKIRYAIMQKIQFTPEWQLERMRSEGKPTPKAAHVIVGYRNLEELNQKIMRFSYRKTKDECLDLPPKVWEFYDIEMTPEQARIYRQMRDVAMAELNCGMFSTASIKLDQLGKLQHILCGHVRQEDGSLYDISERRTDAVVEILQAHSGKAVVWAPYPQALRKIVTRLQKEFGEESTVGYWGATGFEERLDARSRIQNDDKTRFIVSNQSVGKFGNTWTACNLVIYYANSFDNEDRQQSEDRVHRIGQTKTVTYIDLRCKGTIDERLISVLRKKITIASTLQGDSFRQWLI